MPRPFCKRRKCLTWILLRECLVEFLALREIHPRRADGSNEQKRDKRQKHCAAARGAVFRSAKNTTFTTFNLLKVF